jgi:aspartyl/asparaginyl beta-hydroxylase (cupin superfamily)
MTQQEDKIVNLSNNRSITQENYEILAKKLKEQMQRADHFMWKVSRLFDEAFTKYEHSNPNARKLKDFEVHEKRQEAQKLDFKFRKELESEIEALENGVLKYGIDIRDTEELHDEEKF